MLEANARSNRPLDPQKAQYSSFLQASFNFKPSQSIETSALLSAFCPLRILLRVRCLAVTPGQCIAVWQLRKSVPQPIPMMQWGKQPQPATSKIVVLNIEGMTCASCVSAVASALESVAGVTKATVNLSLEQAHVQYNYLPGNDLEVGFVPVSDSALCEAVEAVGFGAAVHSSKTLASESEPSTGTGGGKLVISIEGMTCASCVSTVANALQRQDGVVDASVDLSTENATLQIAPDHELDDAYVVSIIAAIELLGFEAKEQRRKLPALATIVGDEVQWDHGSPEQQRARLLGDYDSSCTDAAAGVESLQMRQSATVARWRTRCIIAGIFAVPNLLITMLLPLTIRAVQEGLMQPVLNIPGLSWKAVIGAILATPVQFGSAIPFYKKAYLAAMNRSFGMDFLVVVGTSGKRPSDLNSHLMLAHKYSSQLHTLRR